MATFQPKYTNLVAMLQDSFTRFADRPLFGTKTPEGWKWTTYGEVSRMVDKFRAALSGLGVKKGDSVAVISNNRVEWAVGAWATYGLGASYVPMYEAQLERDWKYILADSRSKLCLCANDRIFGRVSELKKELPSLEHVVNFDGTAADATSFRHLVEKTEPTVPATAPSDKDIAGFIYTSGTTGNPKGVLLTHTNLASNVSAIGDIIPFDPGDRSLAFLPWAHSFGQTVELHGMTSIGASIAICEAVEKLTDNLAEVKPSILIAVPRIFNRIYDSVQKNMATKPAPIQMIFRGGLRAAAKQKNGESLSLGESLVLTLARKLVFSKVIAKVGGRLKYVVSGSAALSKDVAEFIDNMGIMVFEGYGLTETSPVASANMPGARRIGSVGKPVPGVEIKIDHEASGDPEQGEIVIFGHCVMAGYHNLPEETKAVFTPDGGFRSGDLGRFDKDGFLFITGRIKEQYKLETGKYVAPAHLEEQLQLSPYIAQIMVHGANRPYNVAIVVPDMVSLKEWAAKQGISTATDKLLADAHTSEIIRAELDRFSSEFKSYDKVKKFVLVGEEFTVANDLLTQTLKVKRRNVVKKYEAQIDALYADEPKRAAV